MASESESEPELAATVPARTTTSATGVALTAPDRYELIERLGEGGMGVVWVARDCALDRMVALKVLHDRYLGAVNQERVAAEARAMARLSHRNVVAVYDIGERDGRTYLTMELVRGRDLSRWLESPRSWREVVAVFRAAGAGLVAAHAAGIVHRDIKPSNILIGDDGEARVADFGIARALAPPPERDAPPTAVTAGIVGTPAYMSPERLRGEAADARGDQFGFCAALYEALHGRRPFAGETIDALCDAIARGCPPPVRRVPRWLHAVVARGLGAEPGARFPTMDALVGALAPPRRRAWWIVGGAGAIAVLVALAAWPAATAEREPSRSATAPAAARPAAPVVEPTPRALTALGGCAYSPTFADADTVVFDHTLGDAVDLYKVSVRGGAPVRLTSSPAWEWRASPGRRAGEVMYLSTPRTPGETSTVRFLDVARGVELERDRIALATSSAALAGGAIYYVDAGSEYLRRRAGARDEIIARTLNEESQIAVAPGGRVAVIGAPPGDHARACLAAPGDAALRCLDDRVLAGRPAFSADGSALYVPGVDGIHRRDVATGADRQIAPRAHAHGGVAISPDRRTLVWSECRLQGALVDLSRSPPRVVRDDREVREPVTGAGGRIAWIAGGADRRIEVRQPDGSLVELAAGWDLQGGMSFDRRGDRIAFVARGAQHGIYVTAGATLSAVTMVSGGEHDINPFWVSDHELAFTRLDDHRVPHIYLATTAGGGAARRVLDSRVTMGVRHATRELLLATSDTLWWWSPTTGRERGPVWSGRGTIYSAAVSPDGRWLVVQASADLSGAELWRLRLDPPAAPQLVVRLPSDQTVDTGVSIDDDGHVLAVPRRWRGELFAQPEHEDG